MKLSKKIVTIGLAAVTMSAVIGVATTNSTFFSFARAIENNTYSCNDIVFSETVANPGSYTDIPNLASMGVTNLDCSMTDWTNANYLNNATSKMSDSAIKIGGSKTGKYSGSVKLTLNQEMTASRLIVYATGWNGDTGTIKLGVNGNYQTITNTTDSNYVFSAYTFDLGNQTNTIIFTNDNQATGKGRVVISKIVLRLYNEALTPDGGSSEGGDSPTGSDEIISIETYALANNWVNSTQYSTVTGTSSTLTASGGGNTGKYYDSDHTWRFYANENATLVISSSLNILKLNITYTIKDSGIISYNDTNITSATDVAVSGTNITLSFGSSSGTKGKVFIKSITIYHE